MQRNLERRLPAVETCRYGGSRVAAFFLGFDAASDEEIEYEIEMAASDPDFMPQRLRQLSDTELDLVIKEFDRRAKLAARRRILIVAPQEVPTWLFWDAVSRAGVEAR